jgi:hypothetical protein
MANLVHDRLEGKSTPPATPGGIIAVYGHAPRRYPVFAHFFVTDVKSQARKQNRDVFGPASAAPRN